MELYFKQRTTRQGFPEPKLIAFRRPKDIQDKLVKAKVPEDKNVQILIVLANN